VQPLADLVLRSLDDLGVAVTGVGQPLVVMRRVAPLLEILRPLLEERWKGGSHRQRGHC
jgi:hypothetical protein